MPKPIKPEKAKNFKSSAKELLKSLRRYYFLIVLSVIFSVGSTAVAVIGPQKVSENIQITGKKYIYIDLKYPKYNKRSMVFQICSYILYVDLKMNLQIMENVIYCWQKNRKGELYGPFPL